MDSDVEVPELPPEAEARLTALIAEQRARRAGEDDAERARKALWRTHHWPDEYHRCAVVGGRHVCRRCLVLYPIALTVMAVSLAGFQPWPERLDLWFIWLLCVPATLDFLAEKILGTPYSAGRQIVGTAMVALAFGRGLAIEIDDRWSWPFWGPVLAYCSIWFAAALHRAQRTMFEQALEASVAEGDFSER